MSSKKYALVPMEDDDLGPAKVVKAKKEKSHHRSSKLSKHERTRSRSPRGSRPKSTHRRERKEDYDERWGDEEPAEEAEEEVFQRPSPKRVKVAHNSEDEEERESREFAERMRARAKKEPVEDPATAQRRAMALDASKMPDIREKSRQEYLKKREAEKLALLRLQVQEEEAEQYQAERSGVRLSERELHEFKKNKEVLEIAEQRLRIDDGSDGYYALPGSANATDTLNKRIIERDEYGREKHVTEQDIFEQQQLSKTQGQIQSRERENYDYEYLFEEDNEARIRFVMDYKTSGEGKFFEQQVKAAEKKQLSIAEGRKELPIFQYRDQFLEAMVDNQIMIVVGETGSGKTTQLTQYLVEAGYGKQGQIGCTQPRRVAAMSVAKRVAEEMGCALGKEVGYSVRFDNKTSDNTVIKYLTDGMLLREILSDPELSSYSCIMIDEAHERTISTDILLCLLKDLSLARPDFRLIISSATLDSQKLSQYFNDAAIFNIPGRTFPIEIYYTPQPEANWLFACITTVMQIHTSQPAGDILVFLTGQAEIEAAETEITGIMKKLGNRVQELIVCPIYANLEPELQAKIFEVVPNTRKVVLATNIAETSLTIDGIVYVIDAGFVNQMTYNATTGTSMLEAVPTSRASAGQRAGRAGRTGPGKAFRMYPKHCYENDLPASTPPEILRSNLDSTLLMLKSLGINDVLNFGFLDPPSTESIIASLNKLYALGAVVSSGALSKKGRQLSELPISVELGSVIVESSKHNCTSEVLSIVSILSEASTLFQRPKDKKILADSARARFTVEGGDFLTLLNVWNQWVDSDYSINWCKDNFLDQRSLTRARDVRDQLEKLCERIEIDPLTTCGSTDLEKLQRAFTAGFFTNSAVLQKGGDSYSIGNSKQTAWIHPSSVLSDRDTLPEKLVIYYELVETSKLFMRSCLPIKPQFLYEAAPHYHKKKDMDALEDKKMPKDRSRI